MRQEPTRIKHTQDVAQPRPYIFNLALGMDVYYLVGCKWLDGMYNKLREAAKKVGIKKIGECMSLLWMLSEKKGAGEIC